MNTFTRNTVAAALAITAFGAHAVNLVGITSERNLVRLDTANLGAATSVAITGMAANEVLVGIDTRPSNGKIYGISTANKLYTLDEMTGAATFVVGLTGATIDPALGYGIDFNPLADFNGAASLRLISSAGNNYAVNVTSGVIGNTSSNIGAGFSGAAYTNSALMPTSAPAAPALYYINSSTDMLMRAPGAFNTPTISAVGALGVDVLKANGFEVLANGQAYAALTVDGANLSTGLYGINLATGAATLIGHYNGTLSGLTVSAVPEPGTYALMLAGLVGIGFVARRRRA
jgi:hypothetical protein